ncbi:MAG: type II toxin-antitoxin system HicB family antitoxin [Deltaproteobacteria bacterium]|nr:type II toxin-antitoxin system HicB family antitoxin [Deltaproteobacteria bacterium]
MKRGFAYPVQLTADDVDGGYIVFFPDFPEIITQGNTKAEAFRQAGDALEEALAGRMKRGEEIPYPSSRSQEHLMAIPSPLIAAKVALYVSLMESDLSKVALADKLGCDEKEVRRLLDPLHPSKLPRLSAALNVLGKRLTVNLEDAKLR